MATHDSDEQGSIADVSDAATDPDSDTDTESGDDGHGGDDDDD